MRHLPRQTAGAICVAGSCADTGRPYAHRRTQVLSRVAWLHLMVPTGGRPYLSLLTVPQAHSLQNPAESRMMRSLHEQALEPARNLGISSCDDG